MERSAVAIGKRLSALHKGLGITQADVCRALHIKESRYSQYVTGERRLTLEVAFELVSEYGTSLDWLYLGDRSKLSQDMRDKIPRVA